MTPSAEYARLVILKPSIVQKKSGKVKNKIEHTPTYTSLDTPINNWDFLRLENKPDNKNGYNNKK
jgi:hypothetical protein